MTEGVDNLASRPHAPVSHDPAATRPDGRVPSPEPQRLRLATRALRLHLDELPIAVDEHVSADRFLSGLGFMSARHRYDCAESLVGAAFGGTVLGAMARSLFTDGLRWLWIADDPQARRRALLGDLVQERHRICDLLATKGGHCPNLARWLMPVPAVADLTDESLNWVDATPMPTDEALLDEFLTNSAVAKGQPHE